MLRCVAYGRGNENNFALVIDTLLNCHDNYINIELRPELYCRPPEVFCMSIIGDLTNKISSVVSKAVGSVTQSAPEQKSAGASINTQDTASVSKGYSAGSTKVASLDDVDGGKGSDEISHQIKGSYGSRSSDSAHETTAADKDLSKDVKEIAGHMMESDDVKNPHREDADGNTTMDLEDITVLAASGGNDEIHISNGADGGIIVSVNGEEYSYTRREARTLIIDAGAGNDNVTVDDDVALDLHITGGAGNDKLQGGSGEDIIVDNYDSNVIDGGDGNDTLVANGYSSKNIFEKALAYARGDKTVLDAPSNVIKGGDGNDYIEGGFGNDYINGGEGDDYIYGLDGDDSISGGDGHDYIDGGEGNDILYGGQGNDNLFGGKGNDTISGGAGDDVIAGGKGNDTINGGAGADHITVYQSGGWLGKLVDLNHGDVVAADDEDNISEVAYMGDVPSNISVEGNAAFRARVESDLETLTSIEPGQASLKALKSTGKDVVIRETYGGDYESPDHGGSSITYDKNNRAHLGKGSDSHIAYNTVDHNLYGGDNSWDEVAPIASLVHEMGHSYDDALGQTDSAAYDPITHEHIYNDDGTYATGYDRRGEPGWEYQTVGGLGYKDLEYDGVKRKEHPHGFSENAMRQFLGYELRDSYYSSPNHDREVDTDSL